MKTTIQVSDQTRRWLEALKEQWQLSSCDAVIRRALEDDPKLRKIPSSMAGAFPELARRKE